MKPLSRAALLTMVACAQASAAQPPAPDELSPDKAGTVATGSTSMEFKLRDNLVTFDVTVNGERETAVLDSGAGAIVVDSEAAARLKLHATDPVGEVAGAGTQAQQLRPVELARMTVGSLSFGKVSGYAVNLRQLSSSAGFPIDVLLGAPVFQNRVVTVDYKRERLTFAVSNGGPACASPLAIQFVHGIPVVNAELRPTPDAKPIRLRLLVDLGTRHHAVILGGAFARSAAGAALARAGIPQQVGHGTGGPVQGSVVSAAELRIGDLMIEAPKIALTAGVGAFDAAGVDGSLGAPFWKRGSVMFDYRAKQLCITDPHG